MKKYILFFLWFSVMPAAWGQTLSLDSCRALALRNNKQISVAKWKQEAAYNLRKAMRTKYLPKVDAMGGYEYFSKEISILNNEQKSKLSNLGTNAGTAVSGNLTSTITGLVQQGLLSAEAATQISSLLSGAATPAVNLGNELGQEVVDAFRTDTRNIWAGAVMVRQPIYMGGAITAANRMADIGETMAADETDLKTQTTLYDIDQTYWTVVSLRQKQDLAYSYRDLVKKLDDDVHKMIDQGVATRADGLKVDVKVNEADMQVTQVENGLSLAKMLLCQLCGLPMDGSITLTDEESDNIPTDVEVPAMTADSTMSGRPEIRMLENSVSLSQEAVRLVRAVYLPHVALTGGYLISNPNAFNGFEKKFSGVWNVGVLVQVPVWNWFEGTYKIRAAKAAAAMAEMQLSDTREKINLQVSQCQFRLKEAQKRLTMARQNIRSAEENLRCANVGFREGVMESTDVMAAQTAWQQAQSQKIDAEIGVRLAITSLKKALGNL